MECYTPRLARQSFQLVSRQGLTWLECPALSRFPWLAHGFSTRLDSRSDSPGAGFDVGRSTREPAAPALRNRRRLADALGPQFCLASVHQIHSATVYEVLSTETGGGARPDAAAVYRAAGSEAAPGESLPARERGAAPAEPAAATPGADLCAGDALITSEAGILLSVRTADCLPVLLADPARRVVAAIHAGWRGALERVIEKAAGDLRRLYRSNPERIVAAIGPGIGPCCYEVGGEVVEAFAGRFVESDRFFRKPPEEPPGRQELRYRMLFHTQAPPGHARERSRLHLDLSAVARAQLLAAGLKPERIHAAGMCTCCRADLFFSHRRDGGSAGRMMAAIGVRRPAEPAARGGGATKARRG